MSIKSLNLSENYVPNWGQWEVVREIYCNFLDADPDFTQYVTPHSVTFATNETPSLARLTVLGASTSRGNDNIGEFGEGFKLAALVATRMGYHLEAHTPEGTMSFELKTEAGLSERVLYANITKKQPYDGCKIILHMPDVQRFLKDRFVDRSKTILDKATPGNPAKLFCKGVFIANLAKEALYSWNLNVSTNRDRSIVSAWDAQWAIGSELSRNSNEISQEIYDDIMAHQDSIEMRAIKDREMPGLLEKERLVKAFHNVYGSNAVAADENNYKNKIAKSKGKAVVCLDRGIPRQWGIPEVASIITGTDLCELVDANDEQQTFLNDALSYLYETIEVHIFKDFEDAPLSMNEDCAVFLNERLYLEAELNPYSSLCFEICSARALEADDVDSIEKRLADMSGKLLKMLLNK